MRAPFDIPAATPSSDVSAETFRPALSLDSGVDIDRCSTESLGDRIAELSAHLNAAEYCLLTLLHEFDEREAWGEGGFRSCARWLSWRTGIAPGSARERVRVARALAGLPAISNAMRRGRLSYSKVRAVTRVATPENEADLLEFALTGTAAHVERLVRSWRRVDRLEAAEAEEIRHQQRYLELRRDEDGSIRIEGKLDPEVGAALQRALDAASDTLFQRNVPRSDDSSGEPGPADTASPGQRPGASQSGSCAQAEVPSASQRRADALGLIAERVLAVGLSEGASGQRADRFQVMVHVDATELPEDAESGGATLELEPGEGRDAGLDVPAETFRRLACDASKVTMTHGRQGSVLSVGRRTRTVPAAIRRALRNRDNGCRFPGCGSRFVDAHHLRHWADGGKTALDNLVLLCRHHHRAVHEGGFAVKRLRDGSFRFTRPDGREVTAAPKAIAAHPAWRPLRANAWEHRGTDVEISPWTSASRWAGETLDLELAIMALRDETTEPAHRAGETSHPNTEHLLD